MTIVMTNRIVVIFRYLVPSMMGLSFGCTNAFVSSQLNSKSKDIASQGSARTIFHASTETAGPESTNWDVDLYQVKHSFVYKYGSSLVDILDPQPGESILDVGCGSGELTLEIADRIDGEHNSFTLGMDFDTNMIERAQHQQQKIGNNLKRNVVFFKGDASNFTIPVTPNQQVDAIFSNAALHWVNDASSAVASMSRVLKPGGRFVVEFGGKRNVDQIVQASNQIMGREVDSNPWYFPSIGEYTTLLEQVGDIEVTSAILYDRPTPLEGPDGMKHWLEMFGGSLLQSEDGKSDCDKNVVEEIVNLLRPKLHRNNQWMADYRRIRVVGKKMT